MMKEGRKTVISKSRYVQGLQCLKALWLHIHQPDLIGDPCDFDGDGMLGLGDVDLLRAEVAAGTNTASFDVTGDGLVDFEDIQFFVGDSSKLNTYIGDANLDGQFNSSDFVIVFQNGKFEQDVDATWADGDWDGDNRFDSGDFVVAFQGGGFEAGPKAGVSAVPEPSGIGLFLLGLVAIFRRPS